MSSSTSRVEVVVVQMNCTRSKSSPDAIGAGTVGGSVVVQLVYIDRGARASALLSTSHCCAEAGRLCGQFVSSSPSRRACCGQSRTRTRLGEGGACRSTQVRFGGGADRCTKNKHEAWTWLLCSTKNNAFFPNGKREGAKGAGDADTRRAGKCVMYWGI